MANHCDHCEEPVKWTIGNADTGEQTWVCDGHFVAPAGTDAPMSDPGLCENCQSQPAALVKSVVGTGDRLVLCGGCDAILSRATWLDTPADVQRAVDEAARPLAQHPHDFVVDKRGRGKRVAVDESSSSPLAVAPPPAEGLEPAGVAGESVNGSTPETEG